MCSNLISTHNWTLLPRTIVYDWDRNFLVNALFMLTLPLIRLPFMRSQVLGRLCPPSGYKSLLCLPELAVPGNSCTPIPGEAAPNQWLMGMGLHLWHETWCVQNSPRGLGHHQWDSPWHGSFDFLLFPVSHASFLSFPSFPLEALPSESLSHKCSSKAPFLGEHEPWGNSRFLKVLPSNKLWYWIPDFALLYRVFQMLLEHVLYDPPK